jgi:death-on-curing protein
VGEPIWILDEIVEAIHKRQLAEHGGAVGIRDAGLLQSALARPKHLLAYAEDEVTLTRIAAAYAFGIVRNHPFVDGNKRTGFVVAMLFLRVNGYAVAASQEAKYQTFLALADGRLDEDGLSAWLESYVQAI